MTRRAERISNLIQREIGDLLQQQVNDPRLSSLISVTRVSLSTDLRQAKVFVSVLGDEAIRIQVLQGFSAASGFFRRELASCLQLRYIPELSFHLDYSIERGARILKLIEQVASNETPEDEH